MRIPNLSVSDNVTRTIRDLELKRFELDQQISTGQKLKLPEDDGLRVGRLIRLEGDKSNLSQYKRNSSQAKEFLSAGHLNLDHLRQLNQRALEIARVAGTELNKSAAETYGHEINELVEEALNRINSSHRGTPLFAGDELSPTFGNSEVLLGEYTTTTISLNDSLVGTSSADGNRILTEGEKVVFKLNGREYVVEATKDGLTTSKILEIVRDLINDDVRTLDQSPRLPEDPSNPDPDFPWYRGYVRGGEDDNSYRNSKANLTAEISTNGDLVVSGAVGQTYHASVAYFSQWNPNTYFPEQVDAKIAALTQFKYPDTQFDDLTEAEQETIRQEVFGKGTIYFDVEAEKNTLTEASFPGVPFDDLSDVQKASIMDDVFQNAVESSSTKFEILLDSKASLRFLDEYNPPYYDSDLSNPDRHPLHPTTVFYDASDPTTRNPLDQSTIPDQNGNPVYDSSGNLLYDASGNTVTTSTLRYPSWKNLQADNQDAVWRDAFNEFYNHGDLVYNLSDQQVESLTGLQNSGGNYIFQNYQDTSNIDLPMTGYLKPMELSDDGVWRRSTAEANDDIKITDTANFYALADKDILEFDSLKVNDYIVDQNLQDPAIPTIPVGAAPRMTWTRDVSVDSQKITGNATLDIAHANPWQRLANYGIGELVKYNGSLWESQIDSNFNRIPGNEGGYWKELPSDYSIEREDWSLENIANEERIFFMSPDGKLFETKFEAQQHTVELLLNSRSHDAFDYIDEDLNPTLVEEITYSVAQFEVNGSESDAMTVFDPASQKYRLVSASESGEIIDGPFVKGQVLDSTSSQGTFEVGSVILHKGRYFVVNDAVTANDPATDPSEWEALNATNLEGGGVVLLPNGLPEQGLEKTLLQGDGNTVSGFAGDIIFQRRNPEVNQDQPEDTYFIALNNYSDVADLDNDTSFIEIKAFNTRQGGTWSAGDIYNSGQIVFYKGSYYQALNDGIDGNGIKNPMTPIDELGNEEKDKTFSVYPDDEFYIDGNGESVKNNFWTKLSAEGDLNHVLSFEVDNGKKPAVRIPNPGTSGRQANAEAVVDSNGQVVGLRVLDGGSYFLGAIEGSAFPPTDYESAKIDLDNGGVIDATIMWEEDTTTGSYFISGFSDLTITQGYDNSGSETSSEVGDTFSFATGSRAFLDHRDENGDLLNVTYLGGDQSSKARVGSDTDLNFLLDASNDGTKSLGEVVKSLIDLRDGLMNSNSMNFADEVHTAELELISSEDEIVNKMGELSASLVRIDTVNSHDEEYSLSIDKQISNDLEVDLSEAIMRLSRVSMAYQAAMQVGSQMLNNSLLNYL